MRLIHRHPLIVAILLGALAATGFAPLGWWPLSLIAVAVLMALAERVFTFPRLSRPRYQASTHAGRFLRIRASFARMRHVVTYLGRAFPAIPPIFARIRPFFLPIHLAFSCIRFVLTLIRSTIIYIRFALTSPPGQSFRLGWCFGLGHFTLGNNWIAHAFTYQDAMPHWFGYGAVIALALYLAVYPGLAVLGLHLARRRWKKLAVPPMFAALWIVTEYGRATLFTGFAWDPLGMVWLDTGVDQASRWIGTYGLSGLAVLAGGGVLALVRRQWPLAGMALAGFGALAFVGKAGMPDAAEQTGIAVTIVQPNINQNEKYDHALEQANFAKLAQLTGAPRQGQPRLIFWPEAAIPAWLDVEPEWRKRLGGLLGPSDLLMLGGVKPFFHVDKQGAITSQTLAGAANSAWMLGPGGRILGRYDKAHLVPYGEYLPMRGLLEPLGLSRLVPGDADFWPGPGPRSLPLPVGGEKLPYMGVQICYEMIFSGEVIGGPVRPIFLYNPSNDAWFGSWGPPQHLAQARMRAIEEAMPVIRSTPTGISALIDGQGRVLASIPHHKAGAINARLPRGLPPTLFAHYGNAIPLIFAALLALTAMVAVVGRHQPAPPPNHP